MPLPAAEKGMASYPQPRRWRAVVKQARERQSGKAENSVECEEWSVERRYPLRG